MKFLSTLLVLSVASGLSARDFFVDLGNQSDVNDGLTESTAWKTIPGTRSTDGTTYLNAAWGSITTTAKIGENDTIWLKAGTSHVSANGGLVQLAASSSYYTNGCSNITIRTSQTWGTGTNATINCTGMTVGISAILVQIDGVRLFNISVINSERSAIYGKEKAGDSAPLTNFTVVNCFAQNNGTSFASDLAGSGFGQIQCRRGNGVYFTNNICDGDNNFINGMLLGEAHYAITNGFIVNNTLYGHQGDLSDNDAGIGIKSFNSHIEFINNNSYNNLKGYDSGEQSGNDAVWPGGTAAPISYKYINCIANSNVWGMNFNGPASQYAQTIKFFAVNCLITSNAYVGHLIYSGPYEFIGVHNVYCNNGMAIPFYYEGGHIRLGPNDRHDTNLVTIRIYNSIFFRQTAGLVYSIKSSNPTNQIVLDSDYNSYIQQASETFSYWGWNEANLKEYSYGANGPGKASGSWYTDYYVNATPPAIGTGHFHSDANSRGTGATDTSPPPINSSFVPTNVYSGLNLSTKPWYDSSMGIDRNGNARGFQWTLGNYEYQYPAVGGFRKLKGINLKSR